MEPDPRLMFELIKNKQIVSCAECWDKKLGRTGSGLALVIPAPGYWGSSGRRGAATLRTAARTDGQERWSGRKVALRVAVDRDCGTDDGGLQYQAWGGNCRILCVAAVTGWPSSPAQLVTALLCSGEQGSVCCRMVDISQETL